VNGVLGAIYKDLSDRKELKEQKNKKPEPVAEKKS
jgi:hypothetical protein